MSSDLFVFENNLFSDLFSPFSDTHIDHHHDPFQGIPDSFDESSNLFQENPFEETNSLDQIASTVLSSSPPSHQFESLSLCQAAVLANAPAETAKEHAEYPAFDVKTEECQAHISVIYGYDNSSFVPNNNYGGTVENAVKMMQRSYSSNSFDGKPNFFFQPRFDSLSESPNFQPHALGSPESSFSCGQMRRVCSTGDLQKMKATQTRNTLSSSPLSTERSFIEEAANIKVGRYSSEERKERIHRYRAKRTQRNFNKTIKYACRKTLADNRPRIRGRFARNDEAGEIPKAAMFNRFEEEDELWIEGFHEEDDESSAGRGSFFSGFDSSSTTQYQYFSY